MNATLFQVVIEGEPARFFGSLDGAQTAGLAHIQGGKSVHIEVFPASPLVAMTGFRYDRDLAAWVHTALPIARA